MKYLCIALLLFAAPLQAEEAPDACVIDVTVNGLVCDFCARALEKTFGEEETVASIKVDLDNGLVNVTMKPGEAPLEEERVKNLILDSGYNVSELKSSC